MDAQMIMDLTQKNVSETKALGEVFGTDLQGKCAIVTGGVTGLGYCVVNRLAEAGASPPVAR